MGEGPYDLGLENGSFTRTQNIPPTKENVYTYRVTQVPKVNVGEGVQCPCGTQGTGARAQRPEGLVTTGPAPRGPGPTAGNACLEPRKQKAFILSLSLLC